jgi:hypothetical protein
MNTWTCALAAMLLSMAAPAFAQTGIAGDWDVTLNSPQGASTFRVTFKQDGEKVSGTLKGRSGELPFEGGTLTADDLKFAFTLPFQGIQLEITMTGKVAEGSIAGKANFGGFAEGDWTAKRPDANADGSAAAPTSPASDAPSTPATSATGLNGKWDVVLKTPAGDVPISADFVETDGKITGTMEGPAGVIPVNGTHEGSALKLFAVAKMPQGDVPVTMTGEVTGNEIINGKAELGGVGNAEWSAKRKP